jgi:hypothetical protein
MAEDSNKLKGLREVPASEILAKIEKGEPVEYDHVFIDGNLDISGLSHVKSQITITNSEINGFLNFSEAIFEKPVKFEGTVFIGETYSRKSRFDGYASFSEAKFCKESHFEETIFNGEVYFRKTTFNGPAFFFKTIFCKGIPLGVHFNESVFDKDVHFSEAYFNGHAYFDFANFCSDSFYHDAWFMGSASFNGSHFKSRALFIRSHFEGENLTLKNAEFKNPQDQENACRLAKNAFERTGDRVAASYHFYREMDAIRKQKPWYIRYPEFIFIQLIFGYGVHPFRLWACWFGFVGIFAIVYWLGHGIDAQASQLTGNATIIDYIWFSIATAITPGYAGYKPITEFKLVAGLEAIFGTFMWAAFIATFARKYMR